MSSVFQEADRCRAGWREMCFTTHASPGGLMITLFYLQDRHTGKDVNTKLSFSSGRGENSAPSEYTHLRSTYYTCSSFWYPYDC